MKRPATLLLFALSIIAGGALFDVAFEVSELENRLVVLNKEITRDRNAIPILRAEWSYLNQPGRLEGLSHRYLDLQPLKGSQFSNIAALPRHPLPDILPAATTPEEAAPVDSEIPIASTTNARPRVKPAAPLRPLRHVHLSSQPAKLIPGLSVSENAALNASLRAILGNTAGNVAQNVGVESR